MGDYYSSRARISTTSTSSKVGEAKCSRFRFSQAIRGTSKDGTGRDKPSTSLCEKAQLQAEGPSRY
jgi:hypothetical protein